MAVMESNGRSAGAGRPTEAAFRELIRTRGLLERVQQTYFAQFGLTGSQWAILRHLSKAEENGQSGLRLTDLSDRLLVRPPSVTGVVDRLERAGLVAREGSPADLRAKQITLTDRGREIIERVLAVHGAQIEFVLGGLSTTEVVELHRLLVRFREHLETLLTPGSAAGVN